MWSWFLHQVSCDESPSQQARQSLEAISNSYPLPAVGKSRQGHRLTLWVDNQYTIRWIVHRPPDRPFRNKCTAFWGKAVGADTQPSADLDKSDSTQSGWSKRGGTVPTGAGDDLRRCCSQRLKRKNAGWNGPPENTTQSCLDHHSGCRDLCSQLLILTIHLSIGTSLKSWCRKWFTVVLVSRSSLVLKTLHRATRACHHKAARQVYNCFEVQCLQCLFRRKSAKYL